MFARDLKALDVLNYILKYADDCNLIVPEAAKTSAEVEMQNVLNWATKNKMIVNLTKTKEMVFTRPNPRLSILPPVMSNIIRVNSVRLLGVTFNSVLNFSEHVDEIVRIGNQRMYLISQLKKQGLNIRGCDAVFQSIVLSKLTYALPVFYGYLNEHSRCIISALLRKAKRWQLTDQLYDYDDIAGKMQRQLFFNSCKEWHCLSHLYSENNNSYQNSLRTRGHNFILPFFKFDCNKRCFIVRLLYMYK
jgi:hypothetical protein